MNSQINALIYLLFISFFFPIKLDYYCCTFIPLCFYFYYIPMIQNTIKNIVVVASGKGGVGKSTVSVNLAVSLAKKGLKIGLIDADIYGPSIPLMFDEVHSKPQGFEDNGKSYIKPIEKFGVKLMSVGFFVDPKQALVWRGPMASNALGQLIEDTLWGELDYLILDLPPGTGDIQLTIVQKLAVNGAIVVSTPQQVALADARKAVDMFQGDKINVPVLGLVENMAYFSPHELPNNKYYLFGKEGCKQLAQELEKPLLAQIPIVESICASGDKGQPIASLENNSIAEAFSVLADNVMLQVNLRNAHLDPTKKVEMNASIQIEGCDDDKRTKSICSSCKLNCKHNH